MFVGAGVLLREATKVRDAINRWKSALGF